MEAALRGILKNASGTEMDETHVSFPKSFNAHANGMVDLDTRSRTIFRTIVENYLETGEPVGSRHLSRMLDTTLSPASVRNVMSDLEHLGLLRAPHTSAGRLPTEQGLRFFVDALLEVGDVSDDERTTIEKNMASHMRNTSVEDVLTEASQMLSGLSRGAGVVLTSKQDVRLKQIEFIRLEAEKALVVLVGDDGSVENRVIAIPADVPPAALITAGNYLTAMMAGRTLAQARNHLAQMREVQKQELDQLTAKVVDDGLAVWSGADGSRRSLIVRGRSNLLDDVSAAEDLERIRILFDELEQKDELINLLGLAEEGDGVRIFIGSETQHFSLSGSSVIISPYRDQEKGIVGVLGVIGPTRLNYARIIPVVDYTARMVSRLIG